MILDEISLVAATSRRLSYCAALKLLRASVHDQHSRSPGVVLAFPCGVSFVLGGKKRAAVVVADDAMSLEQRSLFFKHNRNRGQVNTSKVANYGIAESL